MVKTRQFDISKQLFVQAYKMVKANAGAAGIDKILIDIFADARARVNHITPHVFRHTAVIGQSRKFAYFCDERNCRRASHINRKFIIKYVKHIYSNTQSKLTVRKELSYVRMLLNSTQANQWVKITKETLLFQEYFPRRMQYKTRHIPEMVLQQLVLHLDKLGQDIARMIKLIQETGMRIGEAINLDRDCLSKDKEGDYYLTRFEYKMRKEHTVPISSNLAKLIRAQQNLIKRE